MLVAMTHNGTHWRCLGIQSSFRPKQKIVNEQKINIMNLSTKEIGQPEQEPNNEQKADSQQVSPSIANAVLPAVLRPKMGSEALQLLKDGKDIEVENEYVFDLMRYAERKERNISFKCRVNMLNQGWTVIQHGR
jgi:hypothetical protein